MTMSSSYLKKHYYSGYWKFCCANIHNRALERRLVRMARIQNVSLFVWLCSCATFVVHLLIALKQQIQQNPNCQIWMLLDFPYLFHGDSSFDSLHANLPYLPRKPWIILERICACYMDFWLAPWRVDFPTRPKWLGCNQAYHHFSQPCKLF